MARQAEVITKLQQQQPQPTTTSTSHVSTAAILVPSATANVANVQENQGNPTEPIPAQASKAPVYQTEAPFEFEVNPSTSFLSTQSQQIREVLQKSTRG